MNTVWKKVEVDIIHLPPFKECHYLIMIWDDLSKWLKWHTLNNATVEVIVKFLYQNIFCCHSCPQKFIMNKNSENKREVEKLLKWYEIKKMTVSVYHLQINRMIEWEYILIIQTLIKICNSRFIL